MSLAGQKHLADDLAQMTSLRAIENATKFEPGTHLDRWLFVMARRLWLNELRNSALRPTSKATNTDEIEIKDENFSTEMNILAREVFHKMNTLPEAQRTTAMLVFVEGYKYSEAAEILEVPIGTIMSRVSAARKTLVAEFR